MSDATASKTLPVRVTWNSPGHWGIRALWALGTLAFVLYIPTKTPPSTTGDMTFALQLAICAMGLNLVMSYGGVISLGHSAFFTVGGYTSAILISEHGWSHLWTLPMSALFGFIAGIIVAFPALRLKGVYLALVTLCVAVLVPALVKWPKLEWLTHGAIGIHGVGYRDVPQLRFWADDSSREQRAIWLWWVTVAVLVVCYLICRGVVKSRVGRSLVAIRDNDIAASVMGVDVARTKAAIFGLSAAICALGGSLFAIRVGSVNVVDITYFTIVGSILFLVVMVLGGAATLWGPIVGAIVFVYVDTNARGWGGASATADASGIQSVMQKLFGWTVTSPAGLILALVLLIMMFVAPFGIVGLLRKLAAKFVVLLPAPAGSAATVPAAAAAETSAPVGSGTDPHTHNTHTDTTT